MARPSQFTDQEWEELPERVYPRLFQVARKLLGNETEAKDTVQEAFLSFYRVRQNIGSTAILPFLLTIVRNRAMDSWRKRFRRREEEFSDTLTPDPAVAEEFLGNSRTPEEEFLLRNLPSCLHQVVGGLSQQEAQFLAFLLKHIGRPKEDRITLGAGNWIHPGLL